MEPNFTELLDKYRAGTLDPQERSALADQLRLPERLAELERIIDAEFRGDFIEGLSSPSQGAAVFQGLLRSIQAGAAETPKPRSIRLSPRQWIAAASILVLLAAGEIFFLHQRHRGSDLTQTPAPIIAPGGNKAILTLSNGQKIILDSANSGFLTQQGTTNINKPADGQLTYNASAATGLLVYNTLSTPRGGFYQLRLPDGTRVWLNAASSITYPVAFHGHDRSVTLSGEAYFEVAQNKSLPFIVHTLQSSITVLGTEFNANAYTDEQDIRTTLVTGAVKINTPAAEKQLSPGQQSVFDPLNHVLTIHETDVQQAIAWKNGLFEFDHTNLAAIMRQISRWYDVDISYQTTKYDALSFGGGISRNLDLSNVLRLLETNGVHFNIVAKKIIIIP